MLKNKNKSIYILVILVVFLLLLYMLNSKNTFIKIGTGSVNGIYYPTGLAISNLINNHTALKSEAVSSPGSAYNINNVLTQQLTIGIAQSDTQYKAYSDGKKELRSICALHPEIVTLVASAKSKIKSVEGLEKKAVNLGNYGSGHLQNALEILKIYDLDKNKLDANYLNITQSLTALEQGGLDAYFYTIGHPDKTTLQASKLTTVRLISIDSSNVDDYITKYPYYTKAVIKKDYYPNTLNKTDTVSLAVKATLVTSEKVDNEIVYTITKAIFENLDLLKQTLPTLETVTTQDMFKGLTAPIHPGALKYYKEAGLLDYIDESLIK
jgi:uncharacterized protein